MTDIEFIESFSMEVAENYKKIKSVIPQSPGYSLIHIRGFITSISKLILENNNDSYKEKDLFSQINYLFLENLIDEECKNWMHELRQISNKGAHPEKFDMTHLDYKESAANALEKSCKIVEKLYFFVKNVQLPNYTYITEIKDSVMEKLCFLSIIKDDSLSQYEIGKILQLNASEIYRKEIEESEKNELNYIAISESSKLYKKAFYWFSQSSFNNNIDALYEYAMCFIKGEGTEQNLKDGEKYLNSAAYRGCVNAKAEYGNLIINDSVNRPYDLDIAVEFLTESAQDNHPSALDTLGVCYYNGIGVKKDLAKSREFISKSAELGYPNAQYNLAILYLEDKFIKEKEVLAVDLLIKSSNQGHRKAKIKLADMLISGIGCNINKEKAHELYLDYIKNNSNTEENIKVLFDLAGHYYKGTFDFFDFGKALTFLQHIYEHAEEKSKLKQEAYNTAPKVLEKFINNVKNVSKEDYLIMVLFDDNGNPFNNKRERLSFYMNSSFVDKLKFMNFKRFKFLSNKKVGRNAYCPCGSGKKYKACCL